MITTEAGSDVERHTGLCDEGGAADGSSRRVVVAGVMEGASGEAGVAGCQQACTGVTPCQALLGPHQWNAGCQATHWNRGGLLVSLLPLSTNFPARWSRSNPSGPALNDALCHSIKHSVLLVLRHVKEVTGKINLTLNSFSDMLIKKTESDVRNTISQS